MGVVGERSKRRRLLSRFLNLTSRLPRLQRLWTGPHGRLYRVTGGRFVRRWVGAPVLVLETVGRRSGKPRQTPVIYARHGGAFVVAAANAGAESTPAWCLNLREEPTATVSVDDEQFPVRARFTDGEERERLWRLLAEKAPSIDDYLDFTERQFPVVVLEPTDR